MNDSDSDGTGQSSEESSDATKVTEAFILCVIIIAAVVGNISIWLIIIMTKPLRTTTNMFILGLSAADLLVSIANMPLTVVAVITGSWPLSESSCVVFGFINMLTLVTSVLSLCNISINRYFMVCRPSKFQDIYTRRNAFLMITGVVSISLLLSSPPLFGWGQYAYIPIQSFCFCDWANHLSYAIFMISCCFGCPCGVMTVCNIFIYRKVRASRLKVSIKISEASSVENAQDKKKEKTKTTKESKSTRKTLTVTNDVNKVLENDSKENKDLDNKQQCDKNKNNLDDSVTPKTNNFLHPLWAANMRKQKNENTVGIGDDQDNDRDVSDNNSSSIGNESDNRISKNNSSTNFVRVNTSKSKRREEYRLAMSLIVVVIVFVICWMPYCISMLLSIFSKDPVPREFHMFTLIIGYANSCCNPIIYGLMNKRFAAGFRDLYCFWKKGAFRMPVQSSP